MSDAAPPDCLEQNSLVRALLEELPAMVAYWDADLRCRFANRAYDRWFGVRPEVLIGKHISELLGPIYPLNLPHIHAALRGEKQEFEREIPDPAGGTSRHSQANYLPDIGPDGRVRGFFVLVVDITRRVLAERLVRQRERQLQARERIASMATLAAGIAHGINNPLASTLANVELLWECLGTGEVDVVSTRQVLEQVRADCARIRDLVGSMRLLSRADVSKQELVDVSRVLDQSLSLVRSAVSCRALLRRDLETTAAFVFGSPSELAQVIVALLLNAADSFSDQGSKQNEIVLRTRSEGDGIVIEVSDNGSGIPAELHEKIFEPFFSTKDVSGGSGLGLSIARSLVAAMGGEITVRSTVGEGSVFSVRLPTVRPPAGITAPQQAAAGARRSTEPANALSRNRPRVLIIDDEPAITFVLQRILETECEVTRISDAREAVAVLLRSDHEFELILSDIMMPELTGPAIFAAVTEVRPQLAKRFTFMSGSAFTPATRQFIDATSAALLDKPFTPEQVRAFVRDRLEALRPDA